MKDHIAGKGENSLQHYNLVHDTSGCEGSGGKRMVN